MTGEMSLVPSASLVLVFRTMLYAVHPTEHSLKDYNFTSFETAKTVCYHTSDLLFL